MLAHNIDRRDSGMARGIVRRGLADAGIGEMTTPGIEPRLARALNGSGLGNPKARARVAKRVRREFGANCIESRVTSDGAVVFAFASVRDNGVSCVIVGGIFHCDDPRFRVFGKTFPIGTVTDHALVRAVQRADDSTRHRDWLLGSAQALAVAANFRLWSPLASEVERVIVPANAELAAVVEIGGSGTKTVLKTMLPRRELNPRRAAAVDAIERELTPGFPWSDYANVEMLTPAGRDAVHLSAATVQGT